MLETSALLNSTKTSPGTISQKVKIVSYMVFEIVLLVIFTYSWIFMSCSHP